MFLLNRRAATASQVGHDARTGFSNNVVAEGHRGSSLHQAVVPGLQLGQVLEHSLGHLARRPS